MASQFSSSGKYFAQISTDGKLKVWNVVTNSFEQEFIPDFHLTSPCTCLHFVEQCLSISKVSMCFYIKTDNFYNIKVVTTSYSYLISNFFYHVHIVSFVAWITAKKG